MSIELIERMVRNLKKTPVDHIIIYFLRRMKGKNCISMGILDLQKPQRSQ